MIRSTYPCRSLIIIAEKKAAAITEVEEITTTDLMAEVAIAITAVVEGDNRAPLR